MACTKPKAKPPMLVHWAWPMIFWALHRASGLGRRKPTDGAARTARLGPRERRHEHRLPRTKAASWCLVTAASTVGGIVKACVIPNGRRPVGSRAPPGRRRRQGQESTRFA